MAVSGFINDPGVNLTLAPPSNRMCRGQTSPCRSFFLVQRRISSVWRENLVRGAVIRTTDEGRCSREMWSRTVRERTYG